MQHEQKSKNKQQQKGFTLIELMVMIAVVGIMTTVGFVSLKSGQNKNKLKSAQAEITAMIKLAQSYALQGKKDNNDAVPKYYGVKFSADGKSYVFCSSSNATDYGCNNSIETHPFSGGINLSVGQNSLIWFDIPNGNCKLSSAGSLLLTLKLDSNEKTITVSPGGSITEN